MWIAPPGTGGVDTDLDPGDVLTVTAVSDWQGTPGAVGTALAGRHGTLTLQANGAWTYAVDDADPTRCGRANPIPLAVPKDHSRRGVFIVAL